MIKYFHAEYFYKYKLYIYINIDCVFINTSYIYKNTNCIYRFLAEKTLLSSAKRNLSYYINKKYI